MVASAVSALVVSVIYWLSLRLLLATKLTAKCTATTVEAMAMATILGYEALMHGSIGGDCREGNLSNSDAAEINGEQGVECQPGQYPGQLWCCAISPLRKPHQRSQAPAKGPYSLEESERPNLHLFQN